MCDNNKISFTLINDLKNKNCNKYTNIIYVKKNSILKLVSNHQTI